MFYLPDIYRRLIWVKIRSQMQYQIPFLLDVFTTALTSAVAFLTLALVLQKFNNIAGWTLEQIAILYGLIETSFGVMDMLFSGFDPQNFGLQIRLGSFDQLLLRPVNITVQVLGSEFILRRLGRIFQGSVVLVYGLSASTIHWTGAKALLLAVTLVSQVAFFGSLFIIGATITFWTVESIEAINIFTYGGTEMMAYPMDIYPLWMIRFFTFIIPAIFINYYPVLYLLDKPDPLHMLSFAPFLVPAVGFGMLLAALIFWRYGIRHYQSTGT